MALTSDIDGFIYDITCSAMWPARPYLLLGIGVRIHRGLGDSVSIKKPNILTRLNSETVLPC